MLRLAVAVIWLLMVPASQGQVSAFAATSERYPCDALLAATDYSDRPAIALLLGTFGDDLTCLARFLDRNSWRPHLVEFHLSNETCRRNRNCADGELFPQFDQHQWSKVLAERNPYAYQAIADRITNLRAALELLRNSNSSFVLSTGLEDNYTDAAFAELYPFVARHWGGTVVRSGKATPGVLREAHGKNARCGGNTVIANEDGAVQSYRDTDKFLKRNSNCLAAFAWRAPHQGRAVRGGKVTSATVPPKSRTFTFPAADVTALGGIFAKHKH